MGSDLSAEYPQIMLSLLYYGSSRKKQVSRSLDQTWKNPITVLMGRSHIPKSGKLRIATVWEQLYLTSGVFNENFFPNAKSHNVLDISKTVMKKELF